MNKHLNQDYGDFLDTLYIKCGIFSENGFHGAFPKIMFISL